MSKTQILFNAYSMEKQPTLWREVAEYIRDYELDWHMVHPKTNCLGEQARSALSEGASLLAVVGGDGSIHEMAGILAGTDCSLGIVPAGTGNDFCRAAGIPNRTRAALDVLRTGQERSIDLGRCNGRIFVNVAGMGFDALVVKNALPYKARGLGSSRAYLRSVFYTLRHMEFYKILSVEGMAGALPEEMLMVAAGNGHYIGGGMKVTPLAELDDGLLDICLVGKVSIPRFLRIFPSFLGGGHIKAKDTVYYQKVRALEMQFNRPVPMQLDGELLEADHFHIEIVPDALKLWVPAEKSLRS